MSKITEYTTITSPADDDVFLLDGSAGTRTIAYSDLIPDFFDLVNEYSGMHRNLYRGKSLGTSITDDQLSAISDGTFDDIFIGDYWTISSVTWLVADLDYWYYKGDTSFTSHHAVIIPASNLYTAQMNSSSTTSGGYIGSEMYTANLDDAKETIDSVFGDSVLTHREYFTNAITSYYASAGEWVDSTVDLMNENMVYGSGIQRVHNDTTSTIPNNYTIDTSQLALFRLRPQRINQHRSTWWLRDIVSAASFADVNSIGCATSYYASSSYGVRPAFAIG